MSLGRGSHLVQRQAWTRWFHAFFCLYAGLCVSFPSNMCKIFNTYSSRVFQCPKSQTVREFSFPIQVQALLLVGCIIEPSDASVSQEGTGSVKAWEQSCHSACATVLVICIIYYYSGLAALWAYIHLLNSKGSGNHAEPRAFYPASCLTCLPHLSPGPCSLCWDW